MDYATVVAAVDFGTVETGLLAVGIALAGIFVARKGLRLLLGFIK